MFNNIPPVTKNLIVVNVAIYLLCALLATQGIDLTYTLGLHYFKSSGFRLWQPLTYMFMHASLLHLFFNMFGLWMFGGLMERTFGVRRYIIYYITCGLGAAFCQEVSQFLFEGYGLTVGASGALYGILLGFGMCYPDERIFVFPLPVPLKARWFVCIYIAIELWEAVSNAQGTGDGVAHIAHLGGMVFGYLLIKLWRRPEPDEPIWPRQPRQQRAARYRSWTEGKWHVSATTDTPRQSAPHGKEIDDILEKIRRSGYDSLTEEEKKKLFEMQ